MTYNELLDLARKIDPRIGRVLKFWIKTMNNTNFCLIAKNYQEAHKIIYKYFDDGCITSVSLTQLKNR